jgi:hypothetical protein
MCKERSGARGRMTRRSPEGELVEIAGIEDLRLYVRRVMELPSSNE